MKRFYGIFAFLILLSPAAPAQRHFITDANYRQRVEENFTRQKELAKNRSTQLFGIFDKRLTVEEQEALRFLYASMPLSDLADYDGEFFLKIVRASLEARETFPWGKTVPEEIFRHFVLPCRVNTENLDTSRFVFLRELKGRIRNLSMHDAALEVNHWCHEQVTYKGTDMRTIGPLGAIATAYGRCGEETTFGVSALRAVGIPARQCYTPRWAHQDDNHAWIEVWIDGRWYYMGGCEPESEVNMAWFTEPARRAMLIDTRVFGEYTGPEEAITKTPFYSFINVLPSYAVTRELNAIVLDEQRKPVAGATVDFKLYNYAEFYTLATKTTDQDGRCSFTTGLGTLLVWGHVHDRFGYTLVSVAGTDTAVIVLDRETGKEYAEELDCSPPIERTPLQQSQAGKEGNDVRLKREDEIRQTFEATFMDSAKASAFALENGLNADSTATILQQSRGNWRDIAAFLKQCSPAERPCGLQLLYAVSEKDLHDTRATILTAHLASSLPFADKFAGEQQNIFVENILSPRIANEKLTPYKGYLRKHFGEAFADSARTTPEALIDWIRKNIRIDKEHNYYNVPITPIGVYELRVSDEFSRDIFFVAVCRSFGIPARLDPATNIPEYYRNGSWTEVAFEPKPSGSFAKGFLVLKPAKDSLNFTPQYYTHYTIGKFEDGVYRSLDFESHPEEVKPGTTIPLNEGHYVLTTGNRLPDGTVLCRTQYFSVTQGETAKVPFIIRETATNPVSYGRLDLAAKVRSVRSNVPHSLDELSRSKGTVIVWLDPDKEPTKHVMADLQELREWFENWGGGMVLITSQEPGNRDGNIGMFPKLPRQSQFCYDENNALLHRAMELLKTTGEPAMPIVAVVNASGDVQFLSAGYRIGIGEQVVNVLRRTEACGVR